MFRKVKAVGAAIGAAHPATGSDLGNGGIEELDKVLDKVLVTLQADKCRERMVDE